uniref:uncharacterized protein n=1 Tax=Myxine glutinosa TaxID=7769 RepID=UPI00358EE535
MARMSASRAWCLPSGAVCAVLALLFTKSHEDAGHRDLQYERGRSTFDRALGMTRHPRYGPCWTRALDMSQSTCNRLTDAEQRRLALTFTLCHLVSSGRQPPESCLLNQVSSVPECTRLMDVAAFAAYTEFFTHTYSLCFFLQNQVWQEQADGALHGLSTTAMRLSSQLKSSSQLANQAVRAQHALLKTQNGLLRRNREVHRSLHASQQGVLDILAEVKSGAEEQHATLTDIFGKMGSLQHLLLGEFASFYSCLYYPLSCLLACFFTAARSTERARLWLFLLLIANLVSERIVISFTTSSAAQLHSGIQPEPQDILVLVYWRVWCCRKVFLGLGLTIVIYCFWSFRDLARVNHELLRSVLRQQEAIVHLLSKAENKIRFNEYQCASQSSPKASHGTALVTSTNKFWSTPTRRCKSSKETR